MWSWNMRTVNTQSLRIEWFGGVKTTLKLSILEYTHRGKFVSVDSARNTLIFTVVPAVRILVRRAFLNREQVVT